MAEPRNERRVSVTLRDREPLPKATDLAIGNASNTRRSLSGGGVHQQIGISSRI